VVPSPTPEEEARAEIDRLLEAAGWVIQDRRDMNRNAAVGVAVREYPTGNGPADYMLFVDGRIAGVIEAKPKGTTLSGVEEQAGKYIAGLSSNSPVAIEPPPFEYESTGVETFFKDTRDVDARSRRVFAFPKPETMRAWLADDSTFRNRLKTLPPLVTLGLRDCQVEAVTNLERSFADDRPRALLQMATGSGKTYAAITSVYRLVKHAKAKRVLFLVDRNNLGRQADKEFGQYVTPDDGRKFTELHVVQHLKHNSIDPSAEVVITTIQRLYAMLCGRPDYDEELDEASEFEQSDGIVRKVEYNPSIPPEFYHVVWTADCHRSIYNEWRQVLEYFDAFVVGLTATPAKHTIAFFNRNLVMEYGHERAVADHVNVPYEVYRIQTRITKEGSKVKAGYHVDRRDRKTRQVRWEMLDEDLTYVPPQLDSEVVSPDQIRTVVRTFRDVLFTDLFPNRTEVPKTLVFAKDDSHAEDIVRIMREEFARGDDFCKKITYRSTGEKPEDLIQKFRASYKPRIAVTVDMISTGTDIKPVECLLFMRDVRSRVYYEQMKGRGTRVVDPELLRSVTPDAVRKDRFVVVDAVGVTDSPFIEPDLPVERKRTVSFERLVDLVARGEVDDDVLSSLAGRIATLDATLEPKHQQELAVLAGRPLHDVALALFDAVDPDRRVERARTMFAVEDPTSEQLRQATRALVDEATTPFDSPEFRNRLIEMKARSEQVIDTVSVDEVLSTGYSTEEAERVWSTFGEFIEEHKDDIDALSIMYARPYGQRHLTFEQVRELADSVASPPYSLTPELIWAAYERLEKSKVRRSRPEKTLADLVALVRVAIRESETLEPFADSVRARFDNWMEEQRMLGRAFTPEQLAWLTMIRDHIATSLSVSAEDFEDVPFNQHGGLYAARSMFGDDLNKTLTELTEVLAG
jgi:type I restriction enzyme R subunit